MWIFLIGPYIFKIQKLLNVAVWFIVSVAVVPLSEMSLSKLTAPKAIPVFFNHCDLFRTNALMQNSPFEDFMSASIDLWPGGGGGREDCGLRFPSDFL